MTLGQNHDLPSCFKPSLYEVRTSNVSHVSPKEIHRLNTYFALLLSVTDLNTLSGDKRSLCKVRTLNVPTLKRYGPDTIDRQTDGQTNVQMDGRGDFYIYIPPKLCLHGYYK